MLQTEKAGAIVMGRSEESALLPDDAVVELVKAGNLELFELLMRRYNQRLYRVARGILSDDHEAEDVVQEAYMRAYKRLPQFEGRAQFATWLTKIAVNEAITRRNKMRRLEHFATDDDTDAFTKSTTHAMQKTPLEMASLSELGRMLAGEVDRLPSDLRTVFMLRAVEELDTKETAECLDLSEANVKIRLHRARAMLRKRIDNRLGKGVRKLYQFDGRRCDHIVLSVLTRLKSLSPGESMRSDSESESST